MRNCQCGAKMVPVHHNNSGTTQISYACPEVGLDPDWRPWRPATHGHQYVIEARYDHDPNCCTITPEIRTT